MLHVKLKDSAGYMRKAWFIGAVSDSEGIVVYKSDPLKLFNIVKLRGISLSAIDPVVTEPVVDSLHTINMKLKDK